jgi:glycine/D-amino acid oxidase-like deaminating enzyme
MAGSAIPREPTGKNVRSVIVVGGGIFGVTSALELKRRGIEVTIFDSSRVPSPRAASTDISKAIRMDYGSDEFYMRLMEEALEDWNDWNQRWGKDLFHKVGIIFLSKGEMRPGGFEYESFNLLRQKEYHPVRATSPEFRDRFPKWDLSVYQDGYYNPQGGWAESGNVVAALAREAKQAGIRIHEMTKIDHFSERGSRVTGVVTQSGEEHLADVVIVAAGTWTPVLIPELQDVMWPVGQPVFHFKVEDLADYQPPSFVTWGADISHSGWYGFPALEDGTLKLANHGQGWRIDPDGPREIPDGVEDRFRDFLATAFPDLENAPVIGNRMCFYCDTWDGDFWIDRHPDRPGLVVAAGGSGHGFKFAPKIGELISDLIEGKPNPYLARFAWRAKGMVKTEEARHTGVGSK